MMMKEVKEVAAKVQQEEKALRQLSSAAEVSRAGHVYEERRLVGGWHLPEHCG